MDNPRVTVPAAADLGALLHGLNNQLGVILAHAELLQAKAQDDAQRARAAELVKAALRAMTISHALQEHA